MTGAVFYKKSTGFATRPHGWVAVAYVQTPFWREKPLRRFSEIAVLNTQPPEGLPSGGFFNRKRALRMSRLYFIECSADHWIEVARRLKTRGHEIVCWTAWNLLEDKVNKVEEGIFYNTIHAKRGLTPEGREPAGPLFDSACEAVWREDAQMVYDQMNRFDTTCDLSFTERAALFYRTLVYWRFSLKRDKPELVVFPAPPHVVYDYVLLCLCRRLGIKTIMFEEATVFPPHSLVMDDFRVGDERLRQAMSHGAGVLPTQKAQAVVRRMRGDYRTAQPPREVVAQNKRKAARHFGLIGFFLRLVPLYSRLRVRIPNVTSLVKERSVSLRDSFEGRFSNLRYVGLLASNYTRAKGLERIYKGFCVGLDEISKGPFVFMPMPGQPERTSNPQADIFTNQLLMANVLANNLPDGWRLVVKEHPNQLDPNFLANVSYRSHDFYLALASIPNVSLVKSDVDPFYLIDRSQGVATTGGTAALEAVARNRRVLLFGDAWYRDCPGVHRMQDAMQCASIKTVLSEPLTDGVFGLERFLSAVEVSCDRFMADYPPQGYEIDPQVNPETIERHIINRLGR